MNVQNEILMELREMGSTLAGVTRVMPFPVPNNYFAEFADELISNIDRVSTNWVNDNAYTTPEGYFEQLPEEILGEALIGDTAQTFTKAGAYEIPLNYFDALPQQILQKVKAEEQTAPIEGRIVIKWQKAVKWAAAAIVVLGIGLGSYKVMHTKHADTKKALAALPAGTINAYVAQNVDDFETELILNNLSADRAINTGGQLNEQEIIQYLNEEGWDVKTEIN